VLILLVGRDCVCLSVLQPLIPRIINECAALMEWSFTASFCPRGKPVNRRRAFAVRGRLLPAWAVTWAVLYILAWLRATILVIHISKIKSNLTAIVCSVFSFMLISLPVCPTWNTLYCQMCLYGCYCRLSVSAFCYWGVDPSISISDCYLWC
jgi:hypothetical protein